MEQVDKEGLSWVYFALFFSICCDSSLFFTDWFNHPLDIMWCKTLFLLLVNLPVTFSMNILIMRSIKCVEKSEKYLSRNFLRPKVASLKCLFSMPNSPRPKETFCLSTDRFYMWSIGVWSELLSKNIPETDFWNSPQSTSSLHLFCQSRIKNVTLTVINGARWIT